MIKLCQLLTVFLMVVFSLSVFGQYNYKAGRIVTKANDTLIGFINDGGGLKNSKYCIFKNNEESEPKIYYPQDIKSYLFLGDKYYTSEVIPINNDSTSIFCDVLLEGKISLFYPRTGQDFPYYLKLEDGSLVELLDKKIVFDKSVPGENPYHFEKYMYHDTLYTYFKDAGITKKQIANTEYDDKSLLKITKTYLDSTSKGINNISYERSPKIYKPTYGVFSGVQFSRVPIIEGVNLNGLKPENCISFPIGVLYNSPLSLLSDRLSFQMEFMLSKYSYNVFIPNVPVDSANQKLTSTVFSIPLLIKYGIKLKKFTPTLGFGKEIGFVFNSKLPFFYFDPYPGPDQETNFSIKNYQVHWQQKGGWFFDLGLTYQIHPNYALFTSFRLQTQRNLIIEDGNSKNYTYYRTKNEGLGKEYRTNMASIRLGVIF